jgi:hypothetical protein
MMKKLIRHFLKPHCGCYQTVASGRIKCGFGVLMVPLSTSE